jgi:hypothetical protein
VDVRCPLGNPLYALTRTKPVVLALRVTIGSVEIERDFLTSHFVPRCALLRVRRLGADPQALLPLSWPDARWPTGPGAGRPAGVAPARVPFPVRPLRGGMASMIFD